MKAFQYLAPIAPFGYEAPRSIGELLSLLKSHGPKAKLIAGGTDLLIGLKERMIEPEVIIDMSHLRTELSGVRLDGGTLKIGALTTFGELERNPLVARFATALFEASSQVGTLQIRNLGTIGGNLANASPAADAAPPLIALSAEVQLVSGRGERSVPLERFFTGVKKTLLGSDEFISSVTLPARADASSEWMRFARRRENVISVVSVAVCAVFGSGRFERSRVSLGAVAPTPILASESSKALEGRLTDESTIERAARVAREECRPISDVRAGADYRRHLVYALTKRVLTRLVEKGS